MTRDPLPVTLISGYLGAGKTTLVNHLLRNAEGRRLLVMVNDFGELPIDAGLIEAEDGDTLTLSNGCICCSMNGDLAGAFMDVLERDPWPDHLIIEASGVAEPHRIANLAKAEPDLHLSGIVVLSDVSVIRPLSEDPLIGATIASQLKSADLHLLNKTDLVDEAGCEAVERWLIETYPGTAIRCAEARAPLDLVLGEFDTDASAAPGGQHSHESIYMRWSLETEVAFDEARLREVLDRLPRGVLRLKGTVRCVGQTQQRLVQCVGARKVISARVNTGPGTSRLVAIGLKNDVSPEQLDELFKSCCEQ